jgi:calcium uniporter protein, mitochondrial
LTRQELEAYNSVYDQVSVKAGRAASAYMWMGALVPVSTFAVLARLTWWEFSWDVVEPITFFIGTMGPVCFSYLYFCFTKQEYTYSTLRERMVQKRVNKGLLNAGLSPAKFGELKAELTETKERLSKLEEAR